MSRFRIIYPNGNIEYLRSRGPERYEATTSRNLATEYYFPEADRRILEQEKEIVSRFGADRLEAFGPEREDYINLAHDTIAEWLADDASFPCLWFDRIAKNDPQVVPNFVDDVITDSYWQDILAECEQDQIDFTIADIAAAAAEEIQNNIKEWNELTPEEKAQFYDIA